MLLPYQFTSAPLTALLTMPEELGLEWMRARGAVVRWQGTFYSRTAQSFFFSDTGMSEPAEVDPASVPTLPIEEVNFREFHLALARAGYGEDAELNPATGATVRLNAPTDPFGPPDTPQGLVYYVAVAGQGTVQDLFVSSPGWTIHLYQDQD